MELMQKEIQKCSLNFLLFSPKQNVDDSSFFQASCSNPVLAESGRLNAGGKDHTPSCLFILLQNPN